MISFAAKIKFQANERQTDNLYDLIDWSDFLSFYSAIANPGEIGR
jgi:hypothetical protein